MLNEGCREEVREMVDSEHGFLLKVVKCSFAMGRRDPAIPEWLSVLVKRVR